MIVGDVSADGVPVVQLEISGQHCRAIIDTGFNGDLELPERLRVAVNPRFICRIRSCLAAGQFVEEDSYLVDVPFDGHVVTAEATFVHVDEILIGTRLLGEYILEIDFHGRTVALRRARALRTTWKSSLPPGS